MIFSTNRLIIREFDETDLMSIHSYASLVHVTQYQAWGPNSLEQTKAFLKDAIKSIHIQPRVQFELAITLKSNNQQIGGCGIFLEKENLKSAKIGYTLHPDFWGKGFATEAAIGLVDFGIEKLGLEKIQATCDVENIGSKRVLEKSGFQLLKLIKNHGMQKGKMRSSYLFEYIF